MLSKVSEVRMVQGEHQGSCSQDERKITVGFRMLANVVVLDSPYQSNIGYSPP